MLQHTRHFTISYINYVHTYVCMHMWVIFQLILIINLIRKSMNEQQTRTEQASAIGEKSKRYK